MTTKSEILDALQFSFLRDRDLLPSATGTPAADSVVYFKFGGTARPESFALSSPLTGWSPFAEMSILGSGAVKIKIRSKEGGTCRTEWLPKVTRKQLIVKIVAVALQASLVPK